MNADEGKTQEEIAEMDAEKEAKANTQILEMVGFRYDFFVVFFWGGFE